MTDHEIAERDRLAEIFGDKSNEPESDYYCSFSFKEGWLACATYRDSNLPSVEFDEDAARKAWTHNGPDNFTRLTNADVCVYGARWQFEKDNAALAEKDALIDVLRTKVETLKTLNSFCGSCRQTKRILNECVDELEETGLSLDSHDLRLAIDKVIEKANKIRAERGER